MSLCQGLVQIIGIHLFIELMNELIKRDLESGYCNGG